MAKATFNYEMWVARYPEFTAIPSGLASQYFTEAGLYFLNDGTGPVVLEDQQLLLMNMLTAHIAALNVQSQGSADPGASQDANNPVGRISSATQGSVTVSAELSMTPSASGMQAWLTQTRYGLAFWAATGAYRAAYYVPGSLQPGGLQPSPFPFPSYGTRYF